MAIERHFLHSSFREKLIEHLLISELLKHSWVRGDFCLEVSKPEVDNQGYDIVAEANGVIRHVQLKAAYTGSTTSQQKLHVALAQKPSGCIVWIYFDQSSLELGPYLFFGSNPGMSLPEISGLKVARHTRANAEGYKAERPAIRVVPKARFTPFETVDELYEKLFGTVKQAK